jgi:hypothetical protein
LSYEFASPGWKAFMHGMITVNVARLGDDAKGLRWSICEVFTDPPAHLSADGAPIAWFCKVVDDEVTFGDGDVDDVEVKVIADYAAVLPLGRYDTAGDPERAAELARMSAGLVARGELTRIGDRAGRDPRMPSLHDLIARVTT